IPIELSRPRVSKINNEDAIYNVDELYDQKSNDQSRNDQALNNKMET
ncbi:unnamed protein product, partial [Rotaria magnacalcarata]